MGHFLLRFPEEITEDHAGLISFGVDFLDRHRPSGEPFDVAFQKLVLQFVCECGKVGILRWVGHRHHAGLAVVRVDVRVLKHDHLSAALAALHAYEVFLVLRADGGLLCGQDQGGSA